MFVWNLIPALLIYGLSFLVMSNIDVVVNPLTIFAYIWFTISFYLALKSRKSNIDFVTSFLGTAATIMLVFFVLDKSTSNIWNYSSSFETVMFHFLIAQILDITVGGYFNRKTSIHFEEEIKELKADNKALETDYKNIEDYYKKSIRKLTLEKNNKISELELFIEESETTPA